MSVNVKPPSVDLARCPPKPAFSVATYSVWLSAHSTLELKPAQLGTVAIRLTSCHVAPPSCVVTTHPAPPATATWFLPSAVGSFGSGGTGLTPIPCVTCRKLRLAEIPVEGPTEPTNAVQSAFTTKCAACPMSVQVNPPSVVLKICF